MNKQFLKRAGRVVASVQLLGAFHSAAKPPQIQTPAKQLQAQQQQWAKNEKNLQRRSRDRARDLGYQLRTPESAEQRPRDRHDRSLSARPAAEKIRSRSREPRER